MLRVFFVFAVLIHQATVFGSEPTIQIDELQSPVEIGFRGLSVVDSKTVWASGQKGTVLRSVDAGEHWEQHVVPEAEAIDFRDIHAFSADRAVVISAGTPAVSYETIDGGKTWKRCFEDKNPALFFDALEVTADHLGFAFSDPITAEDGSLRFPLLTRTKGESNWHYIPQGAWPVAKRGEAAFAASGSSMSIVRGKVWIGLGGEAKTGRARVLLGSIDMKSWESSETPLIANKSSGIFAVCFVDEKFGVVVGGDYEKPEEAENVVAITRDGGKSWAKPTGNKPSGFRSAVDHSLLNGKRIWLSAGTNGVDFSSDDGENWKRVSDVAVNALQFADGEPIAFTVGPKGKLTRITLSE